MCQTNPHRQALPSWQPHWQVSAAALGAGDWQPQAHAAPTQVVQVQLVVSVFMLLDSLYEDRR